MKYWVFIFSLLTSLASLGQSVPALTNYQGRLTDANGSPVPDGTGYEIELRLWPTATGGTSPMWGTRFSGVAVKGGALNLILGGGGAAIAGAQTTDLKTAFVSPSVFLGMTVTRGAAGVPIANPSEILPRQQWMSSPFAFSADVAAGTLPGAVTSDMISNGAVTSIDLADGSITNSKIAIGAVNGAKIAGQSISNIHVVPGSINLDKLNIADGSFPIFKLSVEAATFIEEQPPGIGPSDSLPSNSSGIRRTLNKTVYLSGDSITRIGSVIRLQPGTFRITASVPLFAPNGHKMEIREVSTGLVILRGTSSPILTGPRGFTPPTVASTSICDGIVNIVNQIDLEINHRVEGSPAAMGAAVSSIYSSSDPPEVYSQITIVRLK